MKNIFTAYPNPFKDGVIFRVPKIVDGHIAIRDIRGVEIKRIAISGDAKEVSIELHDVAAGIYIAELMDGNIPVKALKIVKN